MEILRAQIVERVTRLNKHLEQYKMMDNIRDELKSQIHEAELFISMIDDRIASESQTQL